MSDFGFSTTAEEICSTNELGSNVAGKTVIITGGNTGLGFETARILAKFGAEVLIMTRVESKGIEAVKKIKEECGTASVSYALLDLASFQSIRAAATAFLDSGKPLHILVNNAGIMACPLSYTEDGHESQFGVNHLGHFLFTGLLFPVLEKTGTADVPSRVITLSSIAHHIYAPASGIMFDDLQAKLSYNLWTRYGNSKLANLLFAKELQTRCTARKLHVVSVALHPGVIIETELMRHNSMFMATITNFALLWSRPSKMAAILEKNKTTSQGSATTVACCVYPNLVPGGYYVDCQCRPSNVVHEKAADPDMAHKLWEVSQQLTGLTYL